MSRHLCFTGSSDRSSRKSTEKKTKSNLFDNNGMSYMCTHGTCRPSIGRYSRPICRPRLGRRSTDINQHACRATPSDTSLPLGRYFNDIRPALRSLAQLLLMSSIFSTQMLNNIFQPFERRLKWPSSLFSPSFLQHSSLSFFQLYCFLVIAFIQDPRYFRKQQLLRLVPFGGSLFQGSKK